MGKATYSIQQFRVRLVREKTVKYPVPVASTAKHAAAILQAVLRDADREKIVAIYMNAKLVPVGCEIVAVGGLTGCAIDVQSVLRGAIIAGASSLILGHNHPSGDTTPSREDVELTAKIKAACAVIGIPLVDHIVVSHDRFTSMYETGQMG